MGKYNNDIPLTNKYGEYCDNIKPEWIKTRGTRNIEWENCGESECEKGKLH